MHRCARTSSDGRAGAHHVTERPRSGRVTPADASLKAARRPRPIYARGSDETQTDVARVYCVRLTAPATAPANPLAFAVTAAAAAVAYSFPFFDGNR